MNTALRLLQTYSPGNVFLSLIFGKLYKMLTNPIPAAESFFPSSDRLTTPTAPHRAAAVARYGRCPTCMSCYRCINRVCVGVGVVIL